MESKKYLKATKREKTGKGQSRQLRRQGFIPAVVYGAGPNMHVAISPRQLTQLVKGLRSEHGILPLVIEGESGEARDVIIKDMQVDPITEELLHVDIFEVSMDKRLTTVIPITLSGQPGPVRKGEASLAQLLNEVEIECLPNLIPRELVVDVSALGIGEVMHLKDLTPPEGVRIVRGPDTPVAVLSVMKEEVAEEASEEAAEKA